MLAPGVGGATPPKRRVPPLGSSAALPPCTAGSCAAEIHLGTLTAASSCAQAVAAMSARAASASSLWPLMASSDPRLGSRATLGCGAGGPPGAPIARDRLMALACACRSLTDVFAAPGRAHQTLHRLGKLRSEGYVSQGVAPVARHAQRRRHLCCITHSSIRHAASVMKAAINVQCTKSKWSMQQAVGCTVKLEQNDHRATAWDARVGISTHTQQALLRHRASPLSDIL